LPLSPTGIALVRYERYHSPTISSATTLAKLIRPGGSRTVIANNLLVKLSLIIQKSIVCYIYQAVGGSQVQNIERDPG
jgi:hypothetical protein